MDAYVIQAVAIATALAGFTAPFLTALINRPTWTSERKQFVALGTSVALALVGLIFAGAFTSGIVWTDPVAIGLVVLAVVGASQTIYALVVKTTGIGNTLENLGAPPVTNYPTTTPARTGTPNTEEQPRAPGTY